MAYGVRIVRVEHMGDGKDFPLENYLIWKSIIESDIDVANEYNRFKNISELYANEFSSKYMIKNDKRYLDVLIDDIFFTITTDLEKDQKFYLNGDHDNAQKSERKIKIEAVKYWFLEKILFQIEIFTIKNGGYLFYYKSSKKSTKLLLIISSKTWWYQNFSDLEKYIPDAVDRKLVQFSTLMEKRDLLREYGEFLLSSFYAN